MEALQQQHEELIKRHQDAVGKGESSKARRLERLCKVSHPPSVRETGHQVRSQQYEEAMDATRKGRPFDYNELPTLAGFAPIPVPPSSAPPTSSASLSNTGSNSTSTRTTPSSTLPRPSPTLNHRVVQPPAPIPAAVARASTSAFLLQPRLPLTPCSRSETRSAAEHTSPSARETEKTRPTSQTARYLLCTWRHVRAHTYLDHR